MEFSVRSARDLGEAIRSARDVTGLTQSELSARAGISRSYLAQVERGRSSRLLDLVLDLLRLLDMEVIIRPRKPGEPRDG